MSLKIFAISIDLDTTKSKFERSSINKQSQIDVSIQDPMENAESSKSNRIDSDEMRTSKISVFSHNLDPSEDVQKESSEGKSRILLYFDHFQ